jgi:hypothetical protein
VLKLIDAHPHGSVPAALGVVAHELGHAATRRFDDLPRRQAPSDEWASELTADWYAYRWGFGRQVAHFRKHRDWGHHCVGPGGKFSMDYPCRDGRLRRFYFRVTRNFCVRRVRSVRLKARSGAA